MRQAATLLPGGGGDGHNNSNSISWVGTGLQDSQPTKPGRAGKQGRRPSVAAAAAGAPPLPCVLWQVVGKARLRRRGGGFAGCTAENGWAGEVGDFLVGSSTVGSWQLAVRVQTSVPLSGLADKGAFTFRLALRRAGAGRGRR